MRAVLLSDDRVAQYLRQNFVLCWNSLRPVPKVTIDFGEGRVLERTLKGNTAFHVLRADGTVIDSLPGVYSPDDFLQELEKARAWSKLSESEVREGHRLAQAAPPAEALEAIGKGVVEAPLLKALDAQPPDSLELTGVRDVSATPATLEEYVERYLPGEGSLAERTLREDSESSMRVLRPEIHRLLGSAASLPKLQDWRPSLFKEVLKVDLDDPYLGLRLTGLPATE